MPLPKPVRRIFARAVWRQIGPSALRTISDLVAQGMPIEEARDFALDEVRELLPHLRAPLLRRLTRLGERLDERAEWKWIKSEQIREWVEAYDDIGPLLRALASLSIDLLTNADDDQEGGATVPPLH